MRRHAYRYCCPRVETRCRTAALAREGRGLQTTRGTVRQLRPDKTSWRSWRCPPVNPKNCRARWTWGRQRCNCLGVCDRSRDRFHGPKGGNPQCRVLVGNVIGNSLVDPYVAGLVILRRVGQKSVTAGRRLCIVAKANLAVTGVCVADFPETDAELGLQFRENLTGGSNLCCLESTKTSVSALVSAAIGWLTSHETAGHRDRCTHWRGAVPPHAGVSQKCVNPVVAGDGIRDDRCGGRC